MFGQYVRKSGKAEVGNERRETRNGKRTVAKVAGRKRSAKGDSEVLTHQCPKIR